MTGSQTKQKGSSVQCREKKPRHKAAEPYRAGRNFDCGHRTINPGTAASLPKKCGNEQKMIFMKIVSGKRRKQIMKRFSWLVQWYGPRKQGLKILG
jgi:hypothetical protein